MSIRSTYYCTKDFASNVIIYLLSTDNLSEEQLGNILEEAILNGYYNFVIVSENELKKCKERDMQVLDDIDNLSSITMLGKNSMI